MMTARKLRASGIDVMNTIRHQSEAEQAVNDFAAECWLAAKRHATNPHDDVIERQAALILELAKSNPMVKSFVEQRVKTMRGKRIGPQLEIAQ